MGVFERDQTILELLRWSCCPRNALWEPPLHNLLNILDVHLRFSSKA